MYSGFIKGTSYCTNSLTGTGFAFAHTTLTMPHLGMLHTFILLFLKTVVAL